MHGVPHMPAQNAGIYGARMILFRPRRRKIKADMWATRQNAYSAAIQGASKATGILEEGAEELDQACEGGPACIP
jgi:hypothetical protein